MLGLTPSISPAGALALGPFVQYVPKAALAMLVMCIALSLVHRCAL